MWKHLQRAAACLAGALLFAVPSLANSIGYAVAGSFPAGMPATSVSDPGAAFVLSFEVPVPVAAQPGTIPGGFDVAIPGAQLAFHGQSIGLSVTWLEFFDDADGGGLVLEGTHGADDLLFSLISPQLFRGDLVTPVLMTGWFPVDSGDFYTYLQLGGDQGPVYAPLGDVTIQAVPEPGGVWLSAVSLAGLYFRRKNHITSE